MDFKALMQKRYTTKHYDASKVVPEETIKQILECTRLTPTACNSQPYHFFVAKGDAKAKLREGVMDFNLSRYDGASHAIVITSLTKLSDEHFAKVLAAEEADGRLNSPEIKKAQNDSRYGFSNMHIEHGDFDVWCAKQAYIAFASMVYAAESYGVDSTPVEGIDCAKFDELLGLKEKGLTTLMVVLLGYRAQDDSNTLDKRPKSRVPFDDLVTYL